MGLLSGFRTKRLNKRIMRMSSRTVLLERNLYKSLDRFGVKLPDVKECFKVLGIRPTSNKKKIRSAYIRLMKIYHPDVNSKEGSNEMAQRINEAYHEAIGSHSQQNTTGGIDGTAMANQIIEKYNSLRKAEYDTLSATLRAGNITNKSANALISDFKNWKKTFDKVCNAEFSSFRKSAKSIEREMKLMDSIKKDKLDPVSESLLKENLEYLGSLGAECRKYHAEIENAIRIARGAIESSER